MSGCTSAQHRRAADKEAYGIIRQAERRTLGHTNAFTIDTVYSARRPEDISPEELIDGRLQTNRRVLSIEAALSLAVTNSRDYQARKETLYQAALNLSDARYQYKPIFDAGGELTRDAAGNKSSSADGKFSISQLLLTGGRLSASLANGVLRYYTGDPRRSVFSTISVDLVQPILRGFGWNNPDIETLKQTERNVIYAVRNYSFYQNQFALQIVNDYIGLLAQKDTIRNRYTNFLGRVQASRRLEARAGYFEKLADVAQARQAELTAKNNYVNALANYRNSLDQFKIRLGLPLGEQIFLDDTALDDVEKRGLVPAPMNSDAAYRMAVQRQLPLLNAIDRFEDSKRKVRIGKDQLRTDLKVVTGASYDFNWNQPDDYTRLNADKIAWDAQLQLNLPLDRMRERNSYRRTLMAFETELRSLTFTLDTLKDSIERGLRTLEQRRQNYEIQTNALDVANRRVADAMANLQAGRAEVRNLVEAQDAQIGAQNAVTDALVQYQQSRLQLMLDIGALETESPKFWLKDHVAGFLPGARPATTHPVTAEGAVTPPEEFFKN